jgi:short subunit dehydrogenase-like uncharacterized protein
MSGGSGGTAAFRNEQPYETPHQHDTMAELLLYGSYGYTGELIAEAAVERGLAPVLAGRREEPLAEQAAELDCDYLVFDLDDTDAVTEALDDVTVVLNCAGPFKRTYEPLVEACLDTGTHYLDITGEIDVFRGCADYDAAAADADVMVMPGVGFDVVPTDCLAAHLADRLPEASDLRLGFDPKGLPSGGTLRTAIEDFTEGGRVRRNGDLVEVSPASSYRRIDFGRGTTGAVTIPWGDVVTAHHTTGVPNIEVYLGLPEPVALSLRTAGLFSPLVTPIVGSAPVQNVLQEIVDLLPEGPSERARRRNSVSVWGEAATGDGEQVVSRLETPDGYVLTTDAALAVAERVVDGEAPAGYQTPGGAYGPDLVLELDGVEGFHDE